MVMYSRSSGLKIDQPSRRCFCSEWDLYWVSTRTRRSPECRQLLSVKSMIRYFPPNGTPGLARSAVSGCNRDPTPPAKMIESVFSSIIKIALFQTRRVSDCLGPAAGKRYRQHLDQFGKGQPLAIGVILLAKSLHHIDSLLDRPERCNDNSCADSPLVLKMPGSHLRA